MFFRDPVVRGTEGVDVEAGDVLPRRKSGSGDDQARVFRMRTADRLRARTKTAMLFSGLNPLQEKLLANRDLLSGSCEPVCPVLWRHERRFLVPCSALTLDSVMKVDLLGPGDRGVLETLCSGAPFPAWSRRRGIGSVLRSSGPPEAGCC